MRTNQPQNSYDTVPYESHAFAQTHPNRLETLGCLLGLGTKDPRQCRVLEIGCASGGNLLPMALSLPQSEFVGVDFSSVQIAEGQEAIQELGVANLKLQAMNILDFKNDMGVFDYILCHGVYSWVPNVVNDKILEVCKKSLAPNGIAYVSYNTLPGWHMRGLIRDMLQYHVSPFSEPLFKVKQARNFLDFLANASGRDNNPYSLLLRGELESFHRSSDSYLFHEHLEDVNDPLYFHQFIEEASKAGLKYLGEADPSVMVPGNFPPEIESVLKMLAYDHVHLEQYMDFLRNRMFRQTLLVHPQQNPRYGMSWEIMPRFHVASGLKRDAGSDNNMDPLTPTPLPRGGGEGTDGAANSQEHTEKPGDQKPGVARYRLGEGTQISITDPLVQVAMEMLEEAWPQALPFEKVVEETHKRAAAGTETQAVRMTLGQAFLRLFFSGAYSLFEFWSTPPSFCVTVSARPEASRLARWQAGKKNRVTNLRHESVFVGEFERHLLGLLDGTRDLDALCSATAEKIGAGDLVIKKEGVDMNSKEEVMRAVRESVTAQLEVFAKQALLAQ